MKLVINTGRAVATVARELGINEASLGRWAAGSLGLRFQGAYRHRRDRRHRA
ncbi:transposase [Cryobacterium sp. Y29]|uniref:transposase n=1 Tax=Cryobacterium sp. Y29 TaxID=2048285 RepID=UPI001304C7F3